MGKELRKCDICGDTEDLIDNVDGFNGVFCFNHAYELQHGLINNFKYMESTSPLPKSQEETLTFPEAMQQVILKQRLHKLEWVDRDYYVFLNEGKLQLHKPDGNTYDWIVSEGDLNGDDYIIL